MRRLWFPLQPIAESLFDSAPFRLRETFELRGPASQVWADLTGDDPLAWCRIIQRITWTTPPPYGMGTTRTARALGRAIVFHERFFRWEEGRRHSFYALQASVPLFRRFAEDYLLESTDETSCRLTWTIATEPRGLGRLANPANRLLLSTLFRDTRQHYGIQ